MLLPSSLFLSIGFIILESFSGLNSHSYEAIELVKIVIFRVKINDLLSNFFLCVMLELVCAQSPYNMRRLFAVYMLIITM